MKRGQRWFLWIAAAVGVLAAFTVLVLGSALGLALFRKKVNYPPPVESGSVGAVLPLSGPENGAFFFWNSAGEADPAMPPGFLASYDAVSANTASTGGIAAVRPDAGFENLLDALDHFGYSLADLHLRIPASERVNTSAEGFWYKPGESVLLKLKGTSIFSLGCQAIRLSPADSGSGWSLMTDSVEPVKILKDRTEPLQAIAHAFLADLAGGRIRIRGTVIFSANARMEEKDGRLAGFTDGGLEVLAAGK